MPVASARRSSLPVAQSAEPVQKTGMPVSLEHRRAARQRVLTQLSQAFGLSEETQTALSGSLEAHLVQRLKTLAGEALPYWTFSPAQLVEHWVDSLQSVSMAALNDLSDPHYRVKAISIWAKEAQKGTAPLIVLTHDLDIDGVFKASPTPTLGVLNRLPSGSMYRLLFLAPYGAMELTEGLFEWSSTQRQAFWSLCLQRKMDVSALLHAHEPLVSMLEALFSPPPFDGQRRILHHKNVRQEWLLAWSQQDPDAARSALERTYAKASEMAAKQLDGQQFVSSSPFSLTEQEEKFARQVRLGQQLFASLNAPLSPALASDMALFDRRLQSIEQAKARKNAPLPLLKTRQCMLQIAVEGQDLSALSWLLGPDGGLQGHVSSPKEEHGKTLLWSLFKGNDGALATQILHQLEIAGFDSFLSSVAGGRDCSNPFVATLFLLQQNAQKGLDFRSTVTHLAMSQVRQAQWFSVSLNDAQTWRAGVSDLLSSSPHLFSAMLLSPYCDALDVAIEQWVLNETLHHRAQTPAEGADSSASALLSSPSSEEAVSIVVQAINTVSLANPLPARRKRMRL